MNAAASIDMEFAKYLEKYLRFVRINGGSPGTLTYYEATLKRANRDLHHGLLRSNQEELEDWVFVDGRAQNSKKTYRTVLSGFFEFATDEMQLGDHRLDFNPARYLPKVKTPRQSARPAQRDQLADILARAPEPARTWFTICSGSGLRCVDLSRLDREDCTREAMLVHGKGGVIREVMMHPMVWPVIEPLPAGPVARNTAGGRATPRQIEGRGNYTLHRMGYKVTMHKLRAYFLTELHEQAGGDILVTQGQAGHADPGTTQIYVAVNRSKAAAAVAAIPLPL